MYQLSGYKEKVVVPDTINTHQKRQKTSPHEY